MQQDSSQQKHTHNSYQGTYATATIDARRYAQSYAQKLQASSRAPEAGGRTPRMQQDSSQQKHVRYAGHKH
jgi:hypothetical protein